MKKIILIATASALAAASSAAWAQGTVTVPTTINSTHTVTSALETWNVASGKRVTLTGASSKLVLDGNVRLQDPTDEGEFVFGATTVINGGSGSTRTITADSFRFAQGANGSTTYFTGAAIEDDGTVIGYESGTITLLGNIFTNYGNVRNYISVAADTTLIMGGAGDTIDTKNTDAYARGTSFTGAGTVIVGGVWTYSDFSSGNYSTQSGTYVNGGGTLVFTQKGNRVVGGAICNIALHAENAGSTIEIADEASITVSGNTAVTAGGKLNVYGGFSNERGSTGTGTNVNGSSATYAALFVGNTAAGSPSPLSELYIGEDGHVHLAGTLSINHNGVVNVEGTFTNTAGSIVAIGIGGASTLNILENGSFTTEGALTLNNDSLLNIETEGTLTAKSSVSFSGGSTGEVDGTLDVGSSVSVSGSTTSLLINGTLNAGGATSLDTGATLTVNGEYETRGNLTINNGSAMTVAGVFKNTASTHTVTVGANAASTLHIKEDGSFTTKGALSFNNSSLLDIEAKGTLTANSTVSFSGGATGEVDGTLDVGGRVSVDGSAASLNINKGGTLNAGGLTLDNATTMNIDGTVEIEGDVSLLRSSTMNVSGEFLHKAGYTMTMAMHNNPVTTINVLEGGTFTTESAMNIGISGWAISSRIDVKQGGTFTATDTSVITFLGSGGCTIVVDGIFALEGTMNLTAGNTFTVGSAGTLIVDGEFAGTGGTFAFQGSFGGSGSINRNIAINNEKILYMQGATLTAGLTLSSGAVLNVSADGFAAVSVTTGSGINFNFNDAIVLDLSANDTEHWILSGDDEDRVALFTGFASVSGSGFATETYKTVSSNIGDVTLYNDGTTIWALGVALAPIPEPSTWVLLGTGAVVLAIFRRRRQA